jgi:hypothetical protein
MPGLQTVPHNRAVIIRFPAADTIGCAAVPARELKGAKDRARHSAVRLVMLNRPVANDFCDGEFAGIRFTFGFLQDRHGGQGIIWE